MFNSFFGRIRREWDHFTTEIGEGLNHHNNETIFEIQSKPKKISKEIDFIRSSHSFIEEDEDESDDPRTLESTNRNSEISRHKIRFDDSRKNVDQQKKVSLGSIHRPLQNHHSDKGSLPKLTGQLSTTQSSRRSPTEKLERRAIKRTDRSYDEIPTDNSRHSKEKQESSDENNHDYHQSHSTHRNQETAVAHSKQKQTLKLTQSLPKSLPQQKVLRLIFARHGERINQAFGSDWFDNAFRTKKYQAYHSNLPLFLPRRRYDEYYRFDTPLTVRGLHTARDTGSILREAGVSPILCLSSSSLRCVQTSERLLAGLNCREKVPIRVEPGLFECPHSNKKLIESFMNLKELNENGFMIKTNYQPIVETIEVPESLEQYFSRCKHVLRTIMSRYTRFGGDLLIVSHAPGLLALTEVLRGAKKLREDFYLVASTIQPLSISIAEYNGTKWNVSEQPVNLSLST